MLTRPATDVKRLNKIWAMREDYKDMTNAILKVEKYVHVMKISDMEEYKYFDKWENVYASGRTTFWQGF